MLRAVFVYGTLKRGQCRASRWPAEPQLVTEAWTRGELFGRSDYPAMTSGEDRVLGELWRFDPSDVPVVLSTLDQIEGTGQPGMPDLYTRESVQAFDCDDQVIEEVYAYFYATDPTVDGFARITPGQDGYVSWPE